MEIQYLQVVVMPNGEVIFLGKTIGWKDKVGKYLIKEDRIIKETK